ncbi:aspartate aminotransferase family protein [Inquilinus limosus]|uniref:aspartate aminotransferase family protein n=1 Tax=Inquilinus limosus TaxID=171674 RepID=UPI003F145A35
MSDPRTAALRARRDRLLGPAYRLFYEEPLHVVRGEGVWLYDPDGERYLDAYNNVASVGHCHPHVVAALARQAAVLNTHTRYLGEGVLDYAERLLATFPPEIGHVMFTCTGSEANDLALRVARAVTGGTGVIVTDWAYHGVTVALAEMSPSLGSAVRIGDHVRLVAAPDGYCEPGDVGRAFAARVEAAIEDMRSHGITPAALLVDTIFSSDGVFADPPGFLAPAAAAMRAAGGMVIADEVQPGFGRTGDGMWGFARHGIVPDMVTMGKPMGDGHPIAGMAARPEILAEFGRRTRYFNTFGGNPVSAAVGMAVLDVIEEEGLVANARDTGASLQEALRTLANRHAAIGDVRGAGLFIGVELVRDRTTREPDGALAACVVNGLRRRRVLVSSCGRHGNVLKLRPPLVFGREHAEMLVDALDRTLHDQETFR